MSARPQLPRRRYLSIEQAADQLGVTPRSIRRWISDGTIPAARLGRRIVRIAEDDLAAALRPIPTGGHDAN